MTKKRLFGCITAILVLISMFSGCTNKNIAEKFEVPQYEDDKTITIGAWTSGWIFDLQGTMKPEYWEMYENAYMNMCIATPPNDGIEQLDEAWEHGVSVLVNERNWDGTIPDYLDHPAFLGFCVYDEPTYSTFGKLAAQKKEWLSSDMADKWFFVNVFPSYAEAEHLGENYDTYIKDWIDCMNPEVLSMDHYAIVQNGETKSIRTTWFSDMDVCAHYASEAGIPFWYSLLSAGHMGIYDTASVEEMRWQMAVGQAYGAQGLIHFLFAPQGEDYTAMIDHELTNTTELYDDVVIANAEVAKWDHIYMNFEWQGTDTILGTLNKFSPAFELCKYRVDATLQSCITEITSDEDLLCGMFKDGDDNQGFMLVNATNPADGYDAAVSVTFEKEYTGALIIERGEQRVVALDGNTLDIVIPSSDGIFVIPLVAK